MAIQSWIPLIAGIAYVPLFAILIGNRPWQKQHRLLAWFLAAAMLWSVDAALVRSDFFMQHKLLLFQLDICAFMWATVQFYYFVRFYINQSGGIGTYFGYVSLAAIIGAAALGYMPQSLAFDANMVSPSWGWSFLLVAIPPVCLTVALVWSLVRRYRVSIDPLERDRIVYLLAGVGIVVIFAVGNLSPFGEKFPVTHLGHLANAMILTYVSLRHWLVDVRFIVRRAVVYTCMAGGFLIVYSLWLLLVHRAMGFELGFGSALAVALLTAASVAGFWVRARVFAYRKVDEIFYGAAYGYRQDLIEFASRKAPNIFSLDEFGKELLVPLAKAVGCRQAFLLLPEAGTGDLIAEFAEPQQEGNSPLRMRADSPVLEWLKRERNHLSRENLDVLPEFRSLWDEEIAQFEASHVELLFPLVSRDRLVGVLALSKKRAGKYSLDDVNFVGTIVSQAATSLQKEYLQEQLRKREEELSLINRLTAVMTSSLNVQEVYDAFVAGLRSVVDADFATIALIERDELYFEALYAETGSAWETGQRIPLKGTATEWLASHRKALVEPDLAKKRRFWTGEEYVKQGLRSIVYLPLLVKDQVIGSLIIASRRLNAYSPEQVHLLERLASQIAMPVENSRLYGKAEQRARVDELTGLFNRRSFDESFRQEIDRHSRYSGVLSLILLDLDLFKDYNDREGHLAGDKVLAQVGLLIERSVRSADVAFRYGGDEFAILLPQSSVDDAFVVAERVRGRLAGGLGRKRIGVTASLGLASWPSDGVAPDELVNAADKALYYAKRTGGNRTCVVSKMLPSLAETAVPGASSEKEALSTIYALAATIEARDLYTYGHSRKVSYYAVSIAEALGLPSEKVAIISTAALLHDIGKIGIADEVLNKADKLDDQEWELIKSHPKLSATIVGHVPSLTPCLPAILHHQERWDGTGYPSGLKGEAIPLEARILTVADAFDAMTSPRPYRGPLSYKEALEELKRGSGSQFDPKLVEAFVPIALATVPEELAVGESVDSPKVD